MANNQYTNKVVFNGTTLMDVSGTTVAADKLLQGYTAMGPNGEIINGTLQQQSYDFTGVDVTADKLMKGTKAVNANGQVITGTFDVDEILSKLNNMSKYRGYDKCCFIEKISVAPNTNYVSSTKLYDPVGVRITAPMNSSVLIDITNYYVPENQRSVSRIYIDNYALDDKTESSTYSYGHGDMSGNYNNLIINPGQSFRYYKHIADDYLNVNSEKTLFNNVFIYYDSVPTIDIVVTSRPTVYNINSQISAYGDIYRISYKKSFTTGSVS